MNINPSSQSQGASMESSCYEVEAIRGRRYKRGKYEYFIKWKGWPENTNTWQPLDHLTMCNDMVKAFDQTMKGGKDIQKEAPKEKKPQVQVKAPDPPKKSKVIQKQKVSRREPKLRESESEADKSSNKSSSSSKQQQVKRMIKDTRQKFKSSKGEKDPKKHRSQTQQSMNRSYASIPDYSIQAGEDEKKSILGGAGLKIGKINFHIIDGKDSAKRIYYNVDIRQVETDTIARVEFISSEQLFKENLNLAVEYMQKKIVEYEEYQQELNQWNSAQSIPAPQRTKSLLKT